MSETEAVQSRFVEPVPQPGWPRNRVDLHCHTDRSDGVLPPLELYTQMADLGMEMAAISDHDTLAGYRLLRDALAAGSPPAGAPTLISAVEINSIADRELLDLGVELEEGELHMLGYGIDVDDAVFEARLEGQRNARKARLLMIIEALRNLGMPIDEQIGSALASEKAVGRPHIARAMVAAGYVASVQEAFDRWIDRNGPAYVPRQGMGSREAIDAILAIGGVPVLAHYPAAPEQPQLLRLLMDWGVQGLEVYYRRFTQETVARMAEVADSLGLLPTGGSDFHGDRMSYADEQATTYVPRTVADRLLEVLAVGRVRVA